MKIEIWSDFICPFCYMGKRAFETALAEFPHRDEVEVVYRSYELDPEADSLSKVKVDDILAKKYGMTLKRIKATNEDLHRRAKRHGLDFNHLESKMETNTFNAHRMAKYAAEYGKGAEMTEQLMKAYFTDCLSIGDPETLVRLGIQIGLEQSGLEAVIDSDAFAKVVRADMIEAERLEVGSVPFYAFDRKYSASGTLPVKAFTEMLNKVWAESHPSL